ncbi:hypothetical protein FB451DRAFT_508225 [Mycena latifolia]|nr:hypothetical protein FB451DRAFT_508225 [Mycena latifolia]
MHEELMSDEASGPEDEAIKSFIDWKGRMARAFAGGEVSAAALAEMEFVEVLDPEWRSEKFSALNLELHQTWWDKLTSPTCCPIGILR